MRKTKKNNNKSNPEPYEDIVRLEKLDPYEALIKSNEVLKQNNRSHE
tara:strand:+ start:696 stop:836 length:141 start_codon:yes stop_codon:yes gene_type:complete